MILSPVARSIVLLLFCLTAHASQHTIPLRDEEVAIAQQDIETGIDTFVKSLSPYKQRQFQLHVEKLQNQYDLVLSMLKSSNFDPSSLSPQERTELRKQILILELMSF